MKEQDKKRIYARMVQAELKKLDARQTEILWYFAKNLGRRKKDEGTDCRGSNGASQ